MRAVVAPPRSASFAQGFVAAGCVSAFQDRATPCSAADLRRILRHALQGGTALSAGSRAAQALHRRDYGSALLAVATGAAGVMLIEHLLRAPAQTNTENDHG